MNFIWWLVKRAWQPVAKAMVEYWNKPGSKDKFSGKEEVGCMVLGIVWLVCSLTGSVLAAWTDNYLYFIAGITSFIPMLVILFRSDIITGLSGLHTEYRVESVGTDDKPKRKRKHDDYRDEQWREQGVIMYEDWACEDTDYFDKCEDESDGE